MAVGSAFVATKTHTAAPRGNPLLEVFLFCQLIGLVRYSIIGWVGPWFMPIAAAVQYGSLALLPLLLQGYAVARRPGDGLVGPAVGWLWLLSLTVLAQTAAGFGWGYDTREILQDAAGFVVLAAFVTLGATARFWDDVWASWTKVLAVALAVNMVGMADMGSVIDSSNADLADRVARELTAYRSQTGLAIWPIMLLTCRERSRNAQVFVLVVAAFGFVQQVLFQKRLGTLDFVVYGLLFLYWMPRSVGPTARERIRAAADERRLRGTVFGTLFAGVAVVVTIMPGLFIAQASQLGERFLGTSAHMNKSEAGILTAMVFENERFEIARSLLDDFSDWEWVVGRGMGGYFNVPLAMTGSEARDEALVESLYLRDVDAVGRRSLEVGALFPFIKGGMILMVVVYGGILVAIGRWRRCLADPLSTACLYVSVYELLYLVQGGGFQMNGGLRLLMHAACMGRCLSTGLGRRGVVGGPARAGGRP